MNIISSNTQIKDIRKDEVKMAKIMIDSKDDIMNLIVTEEFAVMVKEFIWDNHKKKHSNKR